MSIFKKSIYFLSIVPTVVSLSLPLSARADYGDTSTYVSRIYTGDGLKATKAYIDQPGDMTVDSAGNFYIADTLNNVIRKIDSNQIISTLAGTGSYGYTNGSAAGAEFGFPEGIDIGSDGSLYVADTDNHAIRKIKNGVVSTLIDDDLYLPKGILVDNSTVYFTDTGHDKIKKVSTSGGAVTTLASGLSSPTKMFKLDNVIYFANTGQKRILKLDLGTNNVSTVATGFLDIGGLTMVGNTMFVVDGDGLLDYLRRVDPATGDKEIIAEDPNMIHLNTSSDIEYMRDVEFAEGHLFVLNRGGSSIYRFNVDGTDPVKFAGKKRFQSKNGTGDQALIGRPKEMVLSPDKKWIYFTENNKIRRIRRATAEVRGLVGNIVDNYNKTDTKEYVRSHVRFSDPVGIAVSPDGKILYVVDRNNNRIRYVRIGDRAVGYLTGSGEINSSEATANGYAEGGACPDEFELAANGCAYFNRPTGLAISPDGQYLYVADSGNNLVRRVVATGPDTGETSFVAGTLEAGFEDGVGAKAKFNGIVGLTINKTGTALFVADRSNHAIRKVRLSDGKVTTVVGIGASGYLEATLDQAQLSYPEYVKFGPDGNLYFTEVGGQHVRLVDFEDNVTKLIAGSGDRGFVNGTGADAEFNNPKGMVVTKAKLYVADNFNDVIRKIDITGEAPFAEQAPTVTSTSPNKKSMGTSSDQTTFIAVTGTDFRHGAVTYFGPYKVVKTYVNSETSITAEIPIGLMEPGFYEVEVVNSDGQSGAKLRAFAVSEADGSVPDTDYFAPD